ncbi:arsenate-mycothiol transferase ArsC [Microbacterium xylanilyticum]
MTRVLMVCRANRCRSPYAAEILSRATGGHVTVESEGFLSGGKTMPAEGQRVATEFGMDFSAHRSREFSAARAGDFDVVLTMARDLSRDVVAAAPDTWPRVFTVREFGPWLRAHPVPRGRRLGDWVAEAAHDRRRQELVGRGKDEIADPFGSPEPAWRSMVAELTPLLTDIAQRIRPAEADQRASSTLAN